VLSGKLILLDKALRDQGIRQTPLNYFIDETMPTEVTMAHAELGGLSIDLGEVRRVQDLELAARASVGAGVEVLIPGPIAAIEAKLVAKAVDGLKKPSAIALRQPGMTKYKTEFQLGNPHHIKALLYDELKLPVQLNNKTKNPTTDESALQTLKQLRPDHRELLVAIEDYREHDKRLSTYIGGPEEGMLSAVRGQPPRFYPEYDARIVTGRLGSFIHTFPE
jgi:hypothetical protein